MTAAPSPALKPLTEAELAEMEAANSGMRLACLDPESCRRLIAMARRAEPQHAADTADAFARGCAEGMDGNRPLPFDRDTAGRFVREAWVRWAETQPAPKPSWLLPYDELSEPDKEADRQIGEAVARWTLVMDAASRALPTPPSPGLDAALAAARAEEREACIQAVVAKAREVGREECCGRGYPSAFGPTEEACCCQPLLMFSLDDAEAAIRARADEREGT